MRRREFNALLAGFAALSICRPPKARAQRRMARVGILVLGGPVAAKDLIISSELARLGYVDGRNISYEIRAADDDLSRLALLARELVAAKPDVLIGASSPLAVALAQATSEIPIVMTVIGDPIAVGVTKSISRPSRNVTGFTLSSPTLAAKRLELLHQLIPGLRKVAYLTMPASPMDATFEQQVRNAAEVLGVTLIPVPITTNESVTNGFGVVDRERVQAVLVESNPTNVRLGAHIIDECLVRDLPAIHTWTFEVRAGALMSYGPAVLENHAGVARYIDRILKGAKVAELPFEEPTEIKLAINLRTARSIKLTIPPTLLARATEVIE
jgi:putative ABC transport system substrate-binding protein